MALVDSSTLIHLAKGLKPAVDAVNEAEAHGPLGISTVAVFELASGSPAGIDNARKALFKTMRIIPFTYDHAEIAGVIDRRLKKKGKEIGSLDSMIAGAALYENEPLITANEKHFKRVEGLKLITY